MKTYHIAATFVLFQLAHSFASEGEKRKLRKKSLTRVATTNNNDTKLIMAIEDDTAIEKQFIVRLEESLHVASTKAELTIAAEKLISGTGATVIATYKNVFSGFAVTGLSSSEAADIARNKHVEIMYQDSRVSITDVASWGLDRIDQRDSQLDDEYNPTFGNGGEGVTAYIIDTGVLTSHTEFGERATNPFNSVNDGVNSDCNGHGTHVAGTVGGLTVGVANKVKIVGVKVLGCSGGGSYATVIAGIDFVIEDAAESGDPSIVNMSLGGPKNDLFDEVVEALVSSGVPTVVAAGNSNADACNVSPANVPTVITVGATQEFFDERSSFSNYGTCLDIFAPGSEIYSAWIGSDNSYITISGTSMASPHVCGVGALFLQEHNNATPDMVAEYLVEESATLDVVLDPGTGSPNKFLFLGDGGNDEDDDEDDDENDGTEDGCKNVPDWYDSDGEEFDCQWYSAKENCVTYGDDYENFNMTANQACCVCGGGLCDDYHDWYDSDGEEFNCDWYAAKDNCITYGDDYRNFNMTANEACCKCKELQQE